MRVTLRGIMLGAAVVAAFVLARAHGTRSLGAVVIPGAIGFGVALWQVNKATRPELTRDSPTNGTVGEQATVGVSVASTDAGQLIVRDQLSAGIGTVESDRGLAEDGLSSRLARVRRRFVGRFTSVTGAEQSGETATISVFSGLAGSYGVEFRDRGEWTIGPAAVHVRDVLGLVERTYELDDAHTILVYPRVRQLTRPASRRLLMVAGSSGGVKRAAFDDLREYDSGDRLRDIHWRISAKRDELIVAEYSEGGGSDRVRVVATTTADSVDAMAEATASLVVPLLDAGVPVDLDLPDRHVSLEPGEGDVALAGLARCSVSDDAAAGRATARGNGGIGGGARDTHVRVDATGDGVTVAIGDGSEPFETLLEDANGDHAGRGDGTWTSDQQSRLADNDGERNTDRRTAP